MCWWVGDVGPGLVDLRRVGAGDMAKNLVGQQSTKIHVRVTKDVGMAYVITDGTLIHIDRVGADRPFYLGKHKCQGEPAGVRRVARQHARHRRSTSLTRRRSATRARSCAPARSCQTGPDGMCPTRRSFSPHAGGPAGRRRRDSTGAPRVVDQLIRPSATRRQAVGLMSNSGLGHRSPGNLP
jgi:hypothetical protein